VSYIRIEYIQNNIRILHFKKSTERLINPPIFYLHMAFIQEAIIKIKSFFVECVRVVRVTKKPDKATYLTIVKVSALGMTLIGAVGFIIAMIAILTGLV